jgi:hypothetical protein
MSAQSSEIPQLTGNQVGYKQPPKHTQFQVGNSGNPGGRGKGNAKVSNAYDRLLTLPEAEFDAFVPSNKAERIAYQRIKEACDYETNHALGATKEVTDRTEGKPDKNINLTVTVNVKPLQVEAFAMFYETLSLEEAKARECARLDAVYAAKDAIERRNVISMQIDAANEEIEECWVKAEEVVNGR